MCIGLPMQVVQTTEYAAWCEGGGERERLDMMLVDHGLLRAIYWNLHPVAAGAWRAAQPSPRRLKQARSLGVRTVLNLRGRRDTCGSYILEREAAERLGLTLIDFIALPARARITVSYSAQGKSDVVYKGTEGFLGLRKL